MINAAEVEGRWKLISDKCMVRCSEEPAIWEADTAKA